MKVWAHTKTLNEPILELWMDLLKYLLQKPLYLLTIWLLISGLISLNLTSEKLYYEVKSKPPTSLEGYKWSKSEMVFGATKWREAETQCRKLQSNSQRNLQQKAMGEKSAHLWMASKVSKIGNYIQEFAIKKGVFILLNSYFLEFQWMTGAVLLCNQKVMSLKDNP